jgi:hypothetical protein
MHEILGTYQSGGAGSGNILAVYQPILREPAPD